MTEETRQDLWLDQHNGIKAIKVRRALVAAVDYAVNEHLLKFVRAATRRVYFARQLPRSVSGTRSNLTTDKIRKQLARIECGRDDANPKKLHIANLYPEALTVVAEQVQQIELVNELLTVPAFGCPRPLKSLSSDSWANTISRPPPLDRVLSDHGQFLRVYI